MRPRLPRPEAARLRRPVDPDPNARSDRTVSLELLQELHQPAETKILLLVLDGVGGLPMRDGGPTELEAASTPNLDRLAQNGSLGLHDPVAPGITPGSGSGHLALFGYDPVRYRIGRGVLEALGIEFALRAGDIAARGNFCTLDSSGHIADRRAGRLPSEPAKALLARLRSIELPGLELTLEHIREHRFLLVLRGNRLSAELTDTDPSREGVPPAELRPRRPEARGTADLVRRFIEEARERLRGEEAANMILLRGFDRLGEYPNFQEATGLRAAAISVYPMYRGVARVVGMQTVAGAPDLEGEIETAHGLWAEHDFVFIHVKDPDRAGEDGDFDEKVRAIEAVDARLPRLLELRPDVVVVTGDHSTPARMKSHSWHPVPLLVRSSRSRPDGLSEFSERACARGGLGRIRAMDILPLALAHAGRLSKFGA